LSHTGLTPKQEKKKFHSKKVLLCFHYVQQLYQIWTNSYSVMVYILIFLNVLNVLIWRGTTQWEGVHVITIDLISCYCLQHSCSPNVFVQNVFVDTHDLRFPWVAFFASRFLIFIHLIKLYRLNNYMSVLFVLE